MSKKKNRAKKRITMDKALVERGSTIKMRQDSFYNPNTGLGGGYDISSNTTFLSDGRMSMHELERLYNENWLASRVIDAPVDDMFSNWIEFIKSNDEEDSNASQIEMIEDLFDEFEIKEKIIHAMKQSRNHYGAAIWFDYGDDERLPLKNPSYKNIKRIEVVNSWYCFPITYYNASRKDVDPSLIGKPEHYTTIIIQPGSSENREIHHSRLILIDGKPPSSQKFRVERRGWGLSVLEPFNSALKSYGISFQSATDAVGEFFWKTLKIEGLAELVANNEDDLIITKAQQAISLMGMKNVGVFGDEEELKRDSANLAGLPEMLDRFTNQVCAAADPGIPHSVLFSAEGGALGGSSAETDLRNYHKRLKSIQNTKGRKSIQKCLLLMGFDPRKSKFKFNNLSEPTLLESLQARKISSEIDKAYVEIGMLTPDEGTKSRFSSDNFDYDSYIIDESERDAMEEERVAEIARGESDSSQESNNES